MGRNVEPFALYDDLEAFFISMLQQSQTERLKPKGDTSVIEGVFAERLKLALVSFAKEHDFLNGAKCDFSCVESLYWHLDKNFLDYCDHPQFERLLFLCDIARELENDLEEGNTFRACVRAMQVGAFITDRPRTYSIDRPDWKSFHFLISKVPEVDDMSPQSLGGQLSSLILSARKMWRDSAPVDLNRGAINRFREAASAVARQAFQQGLVVTDKAVIGFYKTELEPIESFTPSYHELISLLTIRFAFGGLVAIRLNAEERAAQAVEFASHFYALALEAKKSEQPRKVSSNQAYKTRALVTSLAELARLHNGGIAMTAPQLKELLSGDHFEYDPTNYNFDKSMPYCTDIHIGVESQPSYEDPEYVYYTFVKGAASKGAKPKDERINLNSYTDNVKKKVETKLKEKK